MVSLFGLFVQTWDCKYVYLPMFSSLIVYFFLPMWTYSPFQKSFGAQIVLFRHFFLEKGKKPFFCFFTPNFLPRAHREKKRNLARCARRIRYNFVRVQRGFLSVQKLLHFDIYVLLVNFFSLLFVHFFSACKLELTIR